MAVTDLFKENPAPAPGRRPRILFVVDTPNWAHDVRTEHLRRALADEYDVHKRYQALVSGEDLDGADLIVVYYWYQFEALPHLEAAFERNRQKLLVGVCSHGEIEGNRREVGLQTLGRWARGLFAINRRLYDECRKRFGVPVYYTPNGVDTRFYCPGTKEPAGGVLRVGWAGSLGNHGRDHRGYDDLIVPAVESLAGVELMTAVREERWRGPEEMREFYRSLDVYLCASRNEGGPNPCLEAAACGVPLVTAPVGVLPELLRPGINGFFIERDVADIAEKLARLRDDPALRASMAQAIRRDIRAWDWTIRAAAYRQMFAEVLNECAAATRAGEARAVGQAVTGPQSQSSSPQNSKAAMLGQAQANLALIADDFYRTHSATNLTIVVLSYGRIGQTLNAIRALKEHVRIPFKLLLIDNHSDDETRRRLKQVSDSDDAIELVLLDENLGCAGGRAYGVGRVTTDYVMFLDNDIEVLPGAIEHLLHALESQPEVAAVSGNVVFPDGHMHLCGGDYEVTDDLLRFELLGAGQRFDEAAGGSGGCRWVPGGATMFRRDLLVKHPYDLGMHRYYEDLEWCYRLNQAGVGEFYRSARALMIHYHESKTPPPSLPAGERRRQSMPYIASLAHFYKRHGKILQSLFNFVPELGVPTEPLSLSSARLLLELVHVYGAEWVLDQWDREQLAPLFAVPRLLAQVEEGRQAMRALSAEAADKEQTIQRLATGLKEKEQALQRLAAELEEKEQALEEKERALQTEQARAADRQQACERLAAQLRLKERELERITGTLGWRLLRLYGKIKYPYLLPIYRLLHLPPHEPKGRDE
ncbi:MAG TPA: glycosyltransferase [Blastocatellia bacterium]|nr:glycosyltransferase [Blastocatellia bacterium]